MAKLIGNIRPVEGKRRVRLDISQKFGLDSIVSMKDVIELIGKEIPGGVLPTTKELFKFRIVGLEYNTQGVNSGQIAVAHINAFGRNYEIYPSSTRLDAYIKTSETDVYGMWHDTGMLYPAFDKGTTSGLDEWPVANSLDGISKNSTVQLVVDFIPTGLHL